MATMAIESAVLDDIIRRLTEVRLARPGKQLQLSEAEIKQLCTTARDIFLQQPNLLELEAPIKICGNVLIENPIRFFGHPIGFRVRSVRKFETLWTIFVGSLLS